MTVDPARVRHCGPILIDEHRAADQLPARLLESASELRTIQLARMVFMDGMSFVLWACESSGDWVFAEQASHKGITPIIAEVIWSCWSDGIGAEVNNAIADAGEYVGLKLPIKPVPERPVRTAIGMLGEPAAVHELAEGLRRHRRAT